MNRLTQSPSQRKDEATVFRPASDSHLFLFPLRSRREGSERYLPFRSKSRTRWESVVQFGKVGRPSRGPGCQLLQTLLRTGVSPMRFKLDSGMPTPSANPSPLPCHEPVYLSFVEPVVGAPLAH